MAESMTFSPSRPVSERLLLFGGPGSGKSYAWLQIAAMHQRLGSDARFIALDTDSAIERMLCDPAFSELTNVDILATYEWEDYSRNLDQALAGIRSHDWIICDLACNAWDEVQTYYTEQVHGKDPATFFLEHRASLAGRTGLKQNDYNPMDGAKDWAFIKKLHRSWETKFILRPRCNIVCCNKAKALDHKNDPKSILDMYQNAGCKPAGIKQFDHGFHSVLYLSQNQPGDYRITTCKDRNREPFLFIPLQNFAVQYLMQRADWRNS